MSLIRLRAPQGNREILLLPPACRLHAILDQQKAIFARSTISWSDRSLPALRRLAREETFQACGESFAQRDEPIPDWPTSGWLVSGHQPDLFHPGVWLKNFALNQLARKLGFAPLNLVVDSDTMSSPSLKIPVVADSGDPRSVRVTAVPYDLPPGDAPYEERAVRDRDFFRSFPDRVREIAGDWPFQPFLNAFWREVNRQLRLGDNLGAVFAAARRSWERRWGCHNAEVPLSRICRTESWARFVLAIFEDPERFQAIYNGHVRDYQRRHGIRSPRHPVPLLTIDADWVEMPLWIWRVGTHRRQRLFCRRVAEGWQLRCDREVGPSVRNRQAIADLMTLEANGWKVRPRALATTLFARLFLADLFIHGIGGAKYDEMTDQILKDFFHLEPLTFLTLSGTLYLPFTEYPATWDMHRRMARQLRSLYWKPWDYLAEDVQARHASELETVRGLLEQEPRPGPESKDRFHAIRALGERLRPEVQSRIDVTRARLDLIEDELRANAVFRRRDYSFCLYPEDQLREFMTRSLDDELSACRSSS